MAGPSVLNVSVCAQAFLERYLSPGPTMQYQRENGRGRQWTLVSEEPVTSALRQGAGLLPPPPGFRSGHHGDAPPLLQPGGGVYRSQEPQVRHAAPVRDLGVRRP